MEMTDQLRPLRAYAATHFGWSASADGKVATVTLVRPARKNPLTFAAYAELRDLFRTLVYASDVKAVVVKAGANRAVSSCQLTTTDLGQTTRTRKGFAVRSDSDPPACSRLPPPEELSRLWSASQRIQARA